MNLAALREALEKKGLSPVGELQILWTLHIPQVCSVHIIGNDHLEWEITWDGKEYYMEKP